jgi:hypothetical protein
MHEPHLRDDPLRALGSARRAYVIPELRLLYISLAKNACTSIKWLMAELAGEDLASLRPTLGTFPDREAGVHNRPLWKKTPRLHELDPEVRRSISAENGWMVFAVIRDPRTRLFSAWENKYLLRNPAYSSKVNRPWAPRIPRGPQDVIADFAMFVHEIAADPDHEVFQQDAHFRAQTYLLAEHAVRYSRIYDISEIPEMMTELEAHVRANGYDGPPLLLSNSNDTPLPANREVFRGGVREEIEKIYASDFDRFWDRWDFSKMEARELTWTDESFAHTHAVIKANERIADLARAARKLETQNERLSERNVVLRQRVRDLEAMAAQPRRSEQQRKLSLPRRAMSRLRRA